MPEQSRQDVYKPHSGNYWRDHHTEGHVRAGFTNFTITYGVPLAAILIGLGAQAGCEVVQQVLPPQPKLENPTPGATIDPDLIGKCFPSSQNEFNQNHPIQDTYNCVVEYIDSDGKTQTESIPATALGDFGLGQVVIQDPFNLPTTDDPHPQIVAYYDIETSDPGHGYYNIKGYFLPYVDMQVKYTDQQGIHLEDFLGVIVMNSKDGASIISQMQQYNGDHNQQALMVLRGSLKRQGKQLIFFSMDGQGQALQANKILRAQNIPVIELGQ